MLAYSGKLGEFVVGMLEHAGHTAPGRLVGNVGMPPFPRSLICVSLPPARRVPRYAVGSG